MDTNLPPVMHSDTPVVEKVIALIKGGSNRSSCNLLEEACCEALFNAQHTRHLLEIYQWRSRASETTAGFTDVVGWRDLSDESKRAIRLMRLNEFLSYLEDRANPGV